MKPWLVSQLREPQQAMRCRVVADATAFVRDWPSHDRQGHLTTVQLQASQCHADSCITAGPNLHRDNFHMTANLVLVHIDSLLSMLPFRSCCRSNLQVDIAYAWRILHQCQIRRADCPDTLQDSAKILYHLAMTGRRCGGELLQCIYYVVHASNNCCVFTPMNVL